MTIYTTITDTPLGKIQTAAENNALTGLWFIGQKYFPTSMDSWNNEPDYPVFIALKKWLKDYFAGKNPVMLIPLAPSGSENRKPLDFRKSSDFRKPSNFRKSVWKILLEIPYGETVTYGDISAKLLSSGIISSAQAVGGAVGHNPISILIPCHRVIGSDGSLTGYAGGTEKKLALLELEKRAVNA